jgi:hypothetical protein
MQSRRRFMQHAGLCAVAAAGGAVAPRSARPQPRATTGEQTPSSMSQALRADLERHASFGRKFSGGSGDLATADWIATRLQALGYDVDAPTVDMPFFVQRTARLRAGSVTVEVVPQAPVVTTPISGITAPLALVEDEVGDVRGRIVVYVTPFGRHAALFADRGIGAVVARAAAEGALGIVIVTRGPTGLAIALNAPETPFVPVPTAVLAPQQASALIDTARTGAEATLTVVGDATRRPSPNVIARLERGARWIAMSTPRSGWYDCVAERGTGTAAFLELARWLAERFPGHSVWLMNTGGHEYFFAGSHRAIEQAPPPERTAVWAHIGATLAAREAVMRDGGLVMLDSADPQRSLMASASARAAAADAFAGLSGLSDPTPVRPQAGELSAFTDRGYDAAFAVIGVHAWFHTIEDTLERVDARLVEPVVRAHQRAIRTLAGSA